MTAEPTTHPVQVPGMRSGGKVPAVLTQRAYEVYSALYGTGQTLDRLNERAGFGVGELLALLYAWPFPRSEWRARADEAMRGMVVR